jgi:hypothetical protein
MPVEYEIKVEPEDIDYHGNCMASGDDAVDRETEEWIASELDRGNIAAWCSVVVFARFEDFEGIDSLGGCSYKSMTDLEENLIPEMKKNALASLKAHMQRAIEFSVRDAKEHVKTARKALKALEGNES